MARAKFWFRTVNKLLLLALLTFSSLARGETPAMQLAALLEPVQHLSAEFTQTVLGTRRELLQSAEGYLRLARPQQFKWVLLAPYPQTIVTAGQQLFVYDPDLKQVQIRPLADALNGTPALVLLGTASDIQAQFQVAHETVDGVEQFVLVPNDTDALYTEIRMAFSEQRLVRIEIVDSLGQLTDVSFHNLEVNGPAVPEEFEFVVPQDADVIGDAVREPA
jgi:outer membrane lipoprotein carrier protein